MKLIAIALLTLSWLEKGIAVDLEPASDGTTSRIDNDEDEDNLEHLGWWLVGVLVAFPLVLFGSYWLSFFLLADFERPTGVTRDMNELEYVSALMQTDSTELRQDGSLKAVDIALFLRSRYGIDVEASDIAKNLIQNGFSTSQEEENGDDELAVLDLAEFVAVLLIPQLIEAGIGHNSLLDYVWKEICVSQATVNDSNGKDMVLTANMVRKMWLALGEQELAENHDLLERMIAVPETRGSERCTKDGPTGEACTVESFARLLTHDVLLWNVDSFEVMPCGKEQTASKGFSGAGQGKADNIDFVSDKFLSLPICVAAYCNFFISFWVFVFQSNSSITVDFACDSYSFRGTWSENKDAMGCGIGMETANWLITFVIMSTGGAFAVGATTCSNCDAGNASFAAHSLAVMCSIAVTTLPFILTIHFEDVELQETQALTMSRYAAFFVSGVVLIALNVAHMARFQWWGKLNDRFLSHGGQERHVESSAMKKTKSLIQSSVTFSQNVKLHGFALAKEEDLKTELVGGSAWIKDSLFSAETSEDEGVWLSPRLVSVTIMLFLFSLFLFWGLMYVAIYVHEHYEAEDSSEVFVEEVIQDILGQADMVASVLPRQLSKIGNYVSNVVSPFCDNFADLATLDIGNVVDITIDLDPTLLEVCAAANATYTSIALDVLGNLSLPDTGNITYLLQRTGFDFESFAGSFNEFFQSQATTATEGLYPEESYMLSVPLFFCAIVSSLSGMFIAWISVPSAMNRIMKYRSGVIPSLRDPDFLDVRNKNSVKLLLLNGSMVWGMLASSLILGGLVGLTIFLALWQVSTTAFIGFLAWATGLGVANGIYIVMAKMVAGKFTRGNYRKEPTKWNIASLFLESGKFALSVLFITAKTLFASCVLLLNIGRADIDLFPREITPFFAGALLSQPFDAELLVHEAHRHPYIELFGKLAMAKLSRQGDFVTAEGSAWRLMFVLACMPWLRKKRAMTRHDHHHALNESGIPDDMMTLEATRGSLDRAAQALSDFVAMSDKTDMLYQEHQDEIRSMLVRIQGFIEKSKNENRLDSS